jgi:hypothetical protein
MLDVCHSTTASSAELLNLLLARSTLLLDGLLLQTGAGRNFSTLDGCIIDGLRTFVCGVLARPMKFAPRLVSGLPIFRHLHWVAEIVLAGGVVVEHSGWVWLVLRFLGGLRILLRIDAVAGDVPSTMIY